MLLALVVAVFQSSHCNYAQTMSDSPHRSFDLQESKFLKQWVIFKRQCCYASSEHWTGLELMSPTWETLGDRINYSRVKECYVDLNERLSRKNQSEKKLKYIIQQIPVASIA